VRSRRCSVHRAWSPRSRVAQCCERSGGCPHVLPFQQSTVSAARCAVGAVSGALGQGGASGRGWRACGRCASSATMRCMKREPLSLASAVPAKLLECSTGWREHRHNTSIERTSKRLRLLAAAHVERYASAAVRCYSNVGLVRGLRAQSSVPRAVRVSATLSVLGQFAPHLVRGAVVFAHAGACSQVQATQTPRRECVLCEPSLACTPRRGSSAAQRRLHAPVHAQTHRRSNTAAQGWAGANVRGLSRTQNALCCAGPELWVSTSAGAMRRAGASGPGSHNPSIERTNNGWRACAVLRASRAPLFAAHVER
jgi:hypothetical protein